MLIVCASPIDAYCKAVNGTTANLLPTGKYKICRNLSAHVIDKKTLSVRTNKIDSNNNTTTKVHADYNNNNTGFGFLVPKQDQGIDKECQERCQLASVEFAAQRSAAATTTRATTRVTTQATAFGHKYQQIKIRKVYKRCTEL